MLESGTTLVAQMVLDGPGLPAPSKVPSTCFPDASRCLPDASRCFPDASRYCQYHVSLMTSMGIFSTAPNGISATKKAPWNLHGFIMGQGRYGPRPISARAHMGQGPYGPIWARAHMGPGPIWGPGPGPGPLLPRRTYFQKCIPKSKSHYVFWVFL